MARGDRLPDPRDVVSGKARAGLEQLFALVHAVNPTDRALPPRQLAERYAMKAKLQSLLIRQHAAALAVRPAGEGVVSLLHAHSDRDAAHAVLAELEEDARRWAETQLALAALPSAPAAPSSPRASLPEKRSNDPRDPLLLGREALESYDYEGARAHWTAALRTPRAAEAGRALLELLVDHLGDDAGALALEAILPGGVPAEARTRTLLACAAARLGDRSRAERLGRGLDDPSLLAALGDLALRDGDAAEMARLLHALREVEPTNPAVQRLQEGVAALRRDARRPLEAELERLLTEGRRDEAERVARSILDRWPESEPARRHVACVDRERARAEALRVAAQVSAAYDRGEPAAAAALAQRARLLAPDDAEIAAWLDEAEEAAREAALLAAIAAARRSAATGDYGPYLALPDAERARIRQELDRPGLRWIEALPRGPGALDAVRALEEARAHPARALELLTPHLRVLRTIPEARSLHAEAEARAAAEARSAFEVALDAAETAWLEGDLDRARQLAEGLDARQASDEARGRHLGLLTTVRADVATRDTTRRIDGLVASGNALAARDLARRAGLDERGRDLTKAIVAAYAVDETLEEDQPLSDVVLPEEQPVPAIWVTGDGKRIVFASVVSGHVFVRVAEVDDLVVRVGLSFRVPGASGGGVAHVHGATLTVVGEEGWLVQLSLDEREIVRALPPARRPAAVASAHVAPDERSLWVNYRTEPPECAVFDLQDWPRARHVGLPGRAVPIPGEPVVARIVPEGGLMLHAWSGAPKSKEPELKAVRVDRAVPAPGGGAVLGVGDVSEVPSTRKTGIPRVGVHGLFLLTYAHTVRFSGMSRDGGGRRVELATFGGTSRFVTLYPKPGLSTLRIAEYFEDTGFVDGGRSVVPTPSVLAVDAGGKEVVVLSYSEWDLIRGAAFDPVPMDAGAEGDPGEGGPADDDVFEKHVERMRALQPRLHLPLDGLAEPFTCADAETTGPSVLGARSGRHQHHLDALARLRAGDAAGARVALRRGAEVPGVCKLEAVEALLDALDGGGGGVLAEYVTGLLDADREMAAGEWEAARDRVDHAWMWRARERQGLARLVRCWLQIEPKTGTERFRQRLAFASICDAAATGLWVDLPLGTYAIPADAWDELVRRSRARLT